jgi:hypothetical protein
VLRRIEEIRHDAHIPCAAASRKRQGGQVRLADDMVGCMGSRLRANVLRRGRRATRRLQQPAPAGLTAFPSPSLPPVSATMKSLLYSLLLLASARYALAASDKPLKPCTIVSPTTERFFDLNPIRRVPLEDGQKKSKGDADGSWHARGYDYGANFTLNICGPVVEELHDVQDLDKDLWQNVSAFYEVGKKVYSIGYVRVAGREIQKSGN